MRNLTAETCFILEISVKMCQIMVLFNWNSHSKVWAIVKCKIACKIKMVGPLQLKFETETETSLVVIFHVKLKTKFWKIGRCTLNGVSTVTSTGNQCTENGISKIRWPMNFANWGGQPLPLLSWWSPWMLSPLIIQVFFTSHASCLVCSIQGLRASSLQFTSPLEFNVIFRDGFPLRVDLNGWSKIRNPVTAKFKHVRLL